MQRKTLQHPLAIAAAALLGLGSLQQLSAAVYVYTPFDYGLTDGVTLNGVPTGVSGLAGNWAALAPAQAQYSTTGLSFGSNFATTSGGALKLTALATGGNVNSFLGAAFSLTPGTVTGTLWNSYLVQWSAFSDILTAQTTLRTSGAATSNSNSYFRSQAEADKTDTLGGKPAISYSTATTTNPPATPFAYDLGTTYLILNRFTNVGTALSPTTTGLGTLWVFTQSGYDSWVAAGATEADLDLPLSETSYFSFKTDSSPATTGATTGVPTGTYVLDSTRFMQFLQSTTASGTVNPVSFIDEMRYHSSLSDIVVPEPGSAGLLLGGIATLFLVVRRRRS